MVPRMVRQRRCPVRLVRQGDNNMGTIPFRPGELEKPPTVPGGKRALPQRLVNLEAPGPKPGTDNCNQSGSCEVVWA